jgi:hypothetical protein
MNSSSSLESTSFFAVDTRFFEAGNGAVGFVTAGCFGDDPFGGGVNARNTRGTLPYILKYACTR